MMKKITLTQNLKNVTCDRIFKNNDDLNEHHSNDNCGFECTKCGEYFKYEADLKVHNTKNCI